MSFSGFKFKLIGSFALATLISGLLTKLILEKSGLEGLGVWGGLAVSILIAAGFGFVAVTYITRELKALVQHAQTVSSGDLTTQLAISSEDEIGRTSHAFNQMSASLRDLVGQVRTQSDAVAESARGLSHTATEMSGSTEDIATNIQNISRGAEVQSETADRLAKLMKSFSAALATAGDRAEQTARETRASGALATQAIGDADQAMRMIGAISNGLQQNQAQVEGFRERAAEINKIVDIITTIANQTHILALNAAIEAARAGEHGRGFAVVAEEVRRLAENAKGFAEQIAGLAEDIDGASTHLKTAIESVSAQARDGRATVEGAAGSLREISASVLQTGARMEEISKTISEQRTGAAQIERAVAEIASIASENAAATQQVSASTEQQTASMEELTGAANGLARTSGSLRELVARFRT